MGRLQNMEYVEMGNKLLNSWWIKWQYTAAGWLMKLGIIESCGWSAMYPWTIKIKLNTKEPRETKKKTYENIH